MIDSNIDTDGFILRSCDFYLLGNKDSNIPIEELETEKEKMFSILPKDVLESPAWKHFVWDDMDIHDMQRAINKIKKFISNIEEKHIENLKYIELYKDFLDEKVYQLNMFELNQKMGSIQKIVSEKIAENKENEIKSKEKALLNSLPKIDDENKNKNIIYRFDTVKQTKETFFEVGFDFFDCGPDKYQDQCELFCYINDSLFKVLIDAEINSTKNVNWCHRLYWVEKIKDVLIEPFDQLSYDDLCKKKIEQSIKDKELEIKKLKEQIDSADE